VISAREWMQPRNNLGVQTALIAHARCYVGTCGGLAWLAPFLGVPTVAVYADDSMLAPHLLVARQAGRRVSAADFTTLDLRALDRVGAAGRPGVPEGLHAGR
jgi:ADP-heptose:LPS heptosyltransferase